MPDAPLVRRRTVLGVGVAGVTVLTGCDSGEDIEPPGADGSASSTAAVESTTGSTPESPSAPEQTPDEAIVDEVLTALGAALAVLVQARKATVVRQSVTGLLRAHRAHVRALEGDLDNPAPPGPSPDPAAMLRLVRQSERGLHTTLVDAAGRAESGALARLLASMSASVSQHLALLPTEPA